MEGYLKVERHSSPGRSGDRWGEFYNRTITLIEYLANLCEHSRFLERIVQMNPRCILEVGTGTGTMSIFLSHLGYEVVSVDSSPMVLERAEHTNRLYFGKCRFVLCDAFDLGATFEKGSFDVVISQGFFEHFNDEALIELLKEQLYVGRRVIFSVPSKYYPRREMGDERLLTVAEWRSILQGFAISYIAYYDTSHLQFGFPWASLLKSCVHCRPLIKRPFHILAEIER